MGFKEIVESVTPIIIKPSSKSLYISLSKRFFLFSIMNKIINIIEEDPHLNFIALLKSYKILSHFLYGSLKELYRDRNKLYFKKFFHDKELYNIVKEDLKNLYPKYKDLKLTITKRGVIIYDNYKKNSFNVLLMSIHSGRWMPKNIEKKLSITPQQRFKEEDVDTDKIYRDMVLKKGGIWIDNKQTRYAIDFNRAQKTAIYNNASEVELTQKKELWNQPLSKKEKADLTKDYEEFYMILKKLLDSYRFNIIFDGHSMKDIGNRPDISFGIQYVPKFYHPIVRSMQRKLNQLGHGSVRLNDPYEGGFILKWMNAQFPDVFIFSMEINKRIYMNKNGKSSSIRKINRLTQDLIKIFDLEIEEFEEVKLKFIK